MQQEKFSGGARGFEGDQAPPGVRQSIAVYEAARALIGAITPHFDEIGKVCCNIVE